MHGGSLFLHYRNTIIITNWINRLLCYPSLLFFLAFATLRTFFPSSVGWFLMHLLVFDLDVMSIVIKVTFEGSDYLLIQNLFYWIVITIRKKWLSLTWSDRLSSLKFQNISGNIGAKERIVLRIGPWIRRELQAILGDPDPSVIVHVASSLFIASLENNINVHSEQLNFEDESIASLRRFLDDRTSMFWHELRYRICIQLITSKASLI